MSAYYNEIDPFAAQWLRNLIVAGHIAPGDVDSRDIRDVIPAELVRYTQCHFFAGIGLWSHALRLAGWPDDRRVWTGSCPCQPFSTAGTGAGFADERHLWPHWFHLIRVVRPDVIFGEQVASEDALAWLDLVQADLEAENYACGQVDLCSAGIGAPHIRNRAWIVADSDSDGCGETGRSVAASWSDGSIRDNVAGVALGDTSSEGLPACELDQLFGARRRQERRTTEQSGGSFWAGAEWIWCRDEKYRPVEPGTFPLVNGCPGRVGLLRAYGNAINPEAAAEVIRAYMECRP